MDIPTVSALLLSLIEQQPQSDRVSPDRVSPDRVSPDRAVAWLRDQQGAYQQQPTNAQFYRVFTAMPRFTGKAPVVVPAELAQQLDQARPNLQLIDWTLDRLARVWWLLQYPTHDRAAYGRSIGELFRAAEMNELVALYSALPLLAFPEDWRFQATEGIRSNIGDVQSAIMVNNPYPAEQLDEAAWNQLVMKALFTDKDMTQIIGLEERYNPRLQVILRDYADERRAAGRSISDHLTALIDHQ